MRAQGDYETARAAFIARQPMGRLGTPEEIADLAVYLAGATYTTRPGLRYRRRLDDLIRIQGKRDMKLVRYGEVGRERPGVIDAAGAIRDLSGHVLDVAGIGARSGCAGSAVEGRSGKPAAGRRRAAHRPLRCRHRQVHLHRPQLFRPCRRDRRHRAAGADHLHEGELGDRRPERRRRHPARFAEDRLGGRARRRHRQQGQIRLAKPRRWTTSPATASSHDVSERAFQTERSGPVDQGQELRHVRPDRPVAGDQGRGAGSAEPADVAGGRRPDDAERLDQDDGLRRGVPGLLSQPVHVPACRATSSRPARRPASAWA